MRWIPESQRLNEVLCCIITITDGHLQWVFQQDMLCPALWLEIIPTKLHNFLAKKLVTRISFYSWAQLHLYQNWKYWTSYQWKPFKIHFKLEPVSFHGVPVRAASRYGVGWILGLVYFCVMLNWACGGLGWGTGGGGALGIKVFRNRNAVQMVWVMEKWMERRAIPALPQDPGWGNFSQWQNYLCPLSGLCAGFLYLCSWAATLFLWSCTPKRLSNDTIL